MPCQRAGRVGICTVSLFDVTPSLRLYPIELNSLKEWLCTHVTESGPSV